MGRRGEWGGEGMGGERMGGEGNGEDRGMGRIGGWGGKGNGEDIGRGVKSRIQFMFPSDKFPAFQLLLSLLFFSVSFPHNKSSTNSCCAK